MSCNDWKEVKLGDVANIVDSLHKTPKYSSEGYNMVRVTDIKEGYLSLNDTLKVDKVIYNEFTKKYIPQQNDVLMTRVGTYGVCSYVNTREPFCIGQNTVVIHPKEYNKYLYYMLISPFSKDYIEKTVTGSTQKTISLKTIRELPLSLPPLHEQKTIADTLSCFDDKIELNNKINKNLEAQAQAIFKSWFVDFEPFQDGEFVDSELGRIPKGWRVGTLGEVADIQMGQSPKGTSYNENKVGTVFYQGRTDFGIRYPKIRLYTTEPKRIASESDILLSVRAPVGDINIASEKCCIGRGLASLKSNIQCNSFVFYSLLNLKENFAVYNSEGTVFGSINKDTLNNIKVIMPKENVIFDFHKIAGAIDECILINAKQTQTLIALRDTLLPKLMSGEIRVPPSQSIRD